MSNWVFTVRENYAQPSGSALIVLEERIGKNCWPLIPMMTFQDELTAGDRVVFYLVKPEHAFVGDARLATGPVKTTATENKGRIVQFSKARIWKHSTPIKPLIERLEFIKNKKSWGGYMGLGAGVFPISDSDFGLLTEEKV
jgi:hypothetical protein